MSRQPVIGVIACTKQIINQTYHTVGEKYLRAVLLGAGAQPLIIPALGSEQNLTALLEYVDGLLFTGSPSNVDPALYHGPASEPGTLHDPQRDQTSLPLIREAISVGVPLLGICRGFQEINVAFGGTLHQKVHQLPGMLDHREPKEAPLEVQFGPSHTVRIAPNGLLHSLGLPDELTVNSVHGQGVEHLAPGLLVEAVAPDGLIEAFSVAQATTFALGVQWHPEWQLLSNPPYLAIFRAFGDASRKRAELR